MTSPICVYYGTQSPGEDAADRLAVLVVSKLCRTVFAEYESRTAEALAPSLQALDAVRVQAMQYALVGGECLLKPVLHGRGFDFVPIRRDCYAPLGRDAHGALTGVGTMEVLRHDDIILAYCSNGSLLSLFVDLMFVKYFIMHQNV